MNGRRLLGLVTSLVAGAAFTAVGLDGGPETMIDQYSEKHMSRLLWESLKLASGEHTFTLRATGQKHPDSRYIWVTVDHVEIVH